MTQEKTFADLQCLQVDCQLCYIVHVLNEIMRDDLNMFGRWFWFRIYVNWFGMWISENQFT